MARWTGTTTERGYGYEHQQERKRLLELWRPGQPCARCGKPIWDKANTDLGHIDGTAKQAYAGLEHRRCNRAAGARLKNQRWRRTQQPRIVTVTVYTPSRQW